MVLASCCLGTSGLSANADHWRCFVSPFILTGVVRGNEILCQLIILGIGLWLLAPQSESKCAVTVRLLNNPFYLNCFCHSFDSEGNVAQRSDSSGGVLSNFFFAGHGGILSGSLSEPFGYKAQVGYYTDTETGPKFTHRRDAENAKMAQRNELGHYRRPTSFITHPFMCYPFYLSFRFDFEF